MWVEAYRLSFKRRRRFDLQSMKRFATMKTTPKTNRSGRKHRPDRIAGCALVLRTAGRPAPGGFVLWYNMGK